MFRNKLRDKEIAQKVLDRMTGRDKVDLCSICGSKLHTTEAHDVVTMRRSFSKLEPRKIVADNQPRGTNRRDE